MLRALVLFTVVVAGCDGCRSGCGSSASTSFARCMDVDAPHARRAVVGDVRFAIAERTMTVDRPLPIRIAAFRGAGDLVSELPRALSGIVEHRVDLVLVLGGLGSSERSVSTHLRALAGLRAPAVVLAGGDDVASAWDAAWEAGSIPEHLVDGRGLRAIRIGARAIALVSGAPEGFYASDDDACGVSEADLASVRAAVGDRAPFLVSWAAPAGGGRYAVGRGFAGVDSGSTLVAELARGLGASGGLFAFPANRALSPTDSTGTTPVPIGTSSPSLSLVVARAAGAPVDGEEGALVPPAVALVEIGENGVSFLGTTVPFVRDLPTNSGRAAGRGAP